MNCIEINLLIWKMKSSVYSKYFQLEGKYKLEFYSARIKNLQKEKKLATLQM